MSELSMSDASHELIPLYINAIILPTFCIYDHLANSSGIQGPHAPCPPTGGNPTTWGMTLPLGRRGPSLSSPRGCRPRGCLKGGETAPTRHTGGGEDLCPTEPLRRCPTTWDSSMSADGAHLLSQGTRAPPEGSAPPSQREAEGRLRRAWGNPFGAPSMPPSEGGITMESDLGNGVSVAQGYLGIQYT